MRPSSPVLVVDPHPSLLVGAFTTEFPRPLGDAPAPDWLAARSGEERGVGRSEAVRAAVRDLLRRGGYKPTGRGKPSSEYLLRVVEEQGSLPRINAAVDACNRVSLASGLPISVVDLERIAPPLRIGLGGRGDEYVFNASGQTIALAGLLCLFDAEGPCANAVKDAQRAKTGAATRWTLSIVWGTRELAAHLERVVAWYRGLLARAGASTEDVALSGT